MELAQSTVSSQTTEGSLSSPAPTHLTNAFGIRLDGLSRFLKKAGIESTSYRSIPRNHRGGVTSNTNLARSSANTSTWTKAWSLKYKTN